MPKYELARQFWDGTRMHERGDIVEFPEGKAPRGATRIADAEPPKPAAVAKAKA